MTLEIFYQVKKGKLASKDAPIAVFVFNTFHVLMRVIYGLHPDAPIEITWANVIPCLLNFFLFTWFLWYRTEGNIKKYIYGLVAYYSLVTFLLGFCLGFLNNYNKAFTGLISVVAMGFMITSPLTEIVLV